MTAATAIRYPVPLDCDDVDDVITDLEEAWALAPPPVRGEQHPGDWPVKVAARIRPVFRHITGRPVR